MDCEDRKASSMRVVAEVRIPHGVVMHTGHIWRNDEDPPGLLTVAIEQQDVVTQGWDVTDCIEMAQDYLMLRDGAAPSDADRRDAEYAALLHRLREEQEAEIDQRILQPLYDTTIRIADSRGWPIERRGDLGDVALFMGHRMGKEDERHITLMVNLLRSVQDNYFLQIYDGSEMDSYEQAAQELVTFLERADKVVPHDDQTPRDWKEHQHRRG